VLLVALCAARVHAAPTPEADAAAARVHFQAGKSFYDMGQYRDALREFEAGYALAPRARFLLNIGHCHRNLDELEQARDSYRRFLAGVGENDPDRAEARQHLASVEEALAKRPPPQPKPEPRVSAPPAKLVQPASPPKRSRLRHLAWAIPLGVVVVGVAVGVGVYFGTRTDPCAGATLACVPTMR
jgi:tetratricopeptide (TPR) repeat protein